MYSMLLLLLLLLLMVISRPCIQIHLDVLADTKADFAGPFECFGAEAQGSPRVSWAVHQIPLPAAYI